jgi:hypothetical protein
MPNENIAHRIIKLQLSDLVIGNNYSVRYSVHNADALKVSPLLDKTVFDFKAWATTQNAFLHFAHSADEGFVTIKVDVLNVNDNEWSQLFVNVVCQDASCYDLYTEAASSGEYIESLRYISDNI